MGEYCKGVLNISDDSYPNIILRLTNYIPYQDCEESCSTYKYEATEVQNLLARALQERRAEEDSVAHQPEPCPG